MLAFNEDCFRLGYGGGYYDRTIEMLRHQLKRKVLTIGISFEVQKYENYKDVLEKSELDFAIGEHDEQLDYIITEKNVYASNKNY